MLTDTTFWIDLLVERTLPAGQPRPAHEFMAQHRARRLRISVVTWGELAEGFADSADLEWLLRRVRCLGLPKQIVWEGSRLQRQMAAHGRRLGENDTWIAATAKAWGMKLATRDGAFAAVPGLKVERYAKTPALPTGSP